MTTMKNIAQLHVDDKPCLTEHGVDSRPMNPEYLKEAKNLDDRFRDLKQKTKMSRVKFAKTYGVPGGDAMINQHTKATRPISMAAALVYARGFGCSLSAISQRLANEAEKIAVSVSDTTTTDGKKSVRYKNNVENGPGIRGRVPLISWVQAGMWTEAVDVYEPGYAERWLPHLKTNGDKTFALRVVGDSMTAPYGRTYPEGCIIFVNPDLRDPASGDRVIAKLHLTNEVTFKVFVYEAGRRWLKPLNPQHPSIFDNFDIIGKVIGKWEDE